MTVDNGLTSLASVPFSVEWESNSGCCEAVGSLGTRSVASKGLLGSGVVSVGPRSLAPLARLERGWEQSVLPFWESPGRGWVAVGSAGESGGWT